LSSGVIFFCQAEDGIRDRNVTGVQTCALPISRQPTHPTLLNRNFLARLSQGELIVKIVLISRGVVLVIVLIVRVSSQDLCPAQRSEERRVGKECRAQRSR